MSMLSGDVKLSPTQKVRWLWDNFKDGVAGYVGGPRRAIHYWHAPTVGSGDDSPSRKQIDAFLKAHLPYLLRHPHITVLDIGCGTGYLYPLLKQLGYGVSYTGLDVAKRSAFDRNVPGGRLILKKIEDYSPTEHFDLVISNTCLEHVEDDAAGARKALSFGGTQVHIVPTFWSMPLYLWHGYRQYTPRSLYKLFGDRGEFYRLGGVFSFLLHFFFVTIPQRLRVPFALRRNRLYPALCRGANALDRLLPWLSVMYVVVIEPES